MGCRGAVTGSEEFDAIDAAIGATVVWLEALTKDELSLNAWRLQSPVWTRPMDFEFLTAMLASQIQITSRCSPAAPSGKCVVIE